MNGGSSAWWARLEPERKETVWAILAEQKRLMKKPNPGDSSSPIDLCVFVSPTTGKPRVVEVRKKFRDGWILFWRVEKDGTLSAKGLRSPATANREVGSHGTT